MFDNLDNCNNCLCPNGSNEQASLELAREKALEENELERKRLIKDLEKAGVSFPVTALEAMASPRMLGPRPDPEDPEASHDDPPGAAGEDFANKELTSEDYASNMPDDLKDLLRRYYQLEAERDALKGGTNTAPNSENGDSEEPPLERLPTPRAPFWFFRRRSVAVVESHGDCEAQERSGRSRHVLLSGKKNGYDSDQAFSRVTVVYPQERTEKIRRGALFCCLAFVALIVVTVYFAAFKKEDKASETLPATVVVVESSPVPQPTPAPCTPDVELNKQCFVRGEPVVTRFQNCDPLPDDWLGVYRSDENPSALTEFSFDWMYTCGNKQCRGVVQSSLVSFEIYETGTYRIHLIRNEDGSSYEAYASTMEFEVVSNRLGCPDSSEVEDWTTQP